MRWVPGNIYALLAAEMLGSKADHAVTVVRSRGEDGFLANSLPRLN